MNGCIGISRLNIIVCNDADFQRFFCTNSDRDVPAMKLTHTDRNRTGAGVVHEKIGFDRLSVKKMWPEFQSGTHLAC